VRYLTTEQIKAYCRNELPTEDDEFFEQAGNHAEQTLDRACQRRFFVAGTTATTRVYVPNSETRLRIHDAVEVTTILNNGTPVTAGIQLMPLNGVTWAGEARPYEEIELTSGQWWYRDGKEATATVTARWGWASIPDSIQQAALIIAKEIITNRDEVKLGLVGFSDVGGVVARTNPIVRGVIADYRRVESFGIG
jgi:hypothetical protein